MIHAWSVCCCFAVLLFCCFAALCIFREKREEEFTAVVESIVARGGSCLIPVFALGRAQELLLILDEHWQESPELQVSIIMILIIVRACLCSGTGGTDF